MFPVTAVQPRLRWFRLLFGIFLSLWLVPAGWAAAQRPNIVLYLSDDLGVDFVGCYGNKAIRTPNIDQLAAQGMKFQRVFAASPTCSPSRASIYSGMYPSRNGLMGNHTGSKDGVKSLPHYLGELGYRVVLANKVHVKPQAVYPFEMLKATLPPDPKNPRRYRAEGLDAGAVDKFLAGHAKENPDQPLCLVLADNNPHVLWEKNKTYNPNKLPIPPIMVDTAKTRTALANYYQDITTLDDRVGKVMGSLKKHGFEDNTLFIFTSDQGAEWPHCKWTVYDTGLRVPFIARWPGKIKPNTTNPALISFVDLLPTFYDLAGGGKLEGIDGLSFKDVLLGEQKKFRETIFASHTGDGEMNMCPQRCVRDERYKLVLNLNPERKWTTHFTKVEGIKDSHAEVYSTWTAKAKEDVIAAHLVNLIENHPKWELYDTRSDPYELRNLIGHGGHAKRVARLKAELQDWLKQQGDEEGAKAAND